MNFKYTKKGFSLFEMVIYVAILAVILLVTTNALILVLSSFRNISSTVNLQSSAIISLNKIQNTLKNGTEIVLAESVFNVDNGILTLNSINNDGFVSKYKFYVEDGRLKLDINGSFNKILTTEDIIVKSFILRNISTSKSKAVRVEMTLESNIKGDIKDKTFYTTAILMGTYQNE
ncbi:MAG: prepilin-type N-terminal cleavage/methylation domain-containing protein [Chitinophagaceae bacterium]|nr:prepilin-type N-terminal cleavage/methylation domain-containing protein [Chitinophagaceae bacterium]